MSKKIKKSKRIPGLQKHKKHASSPAVAPLLQKILQRASALQRSGRLAQAEALYRQILQDNPNHPEALHHLGMIAHQVGKNRVAVELLSRALSLQPHYVEAHFNLGIVLQALGKPKQAAASFRRVISLKPDLVGAYNNLGFVLQNMNRPDEAAECFRQALNMKPDFAEAHNNLGNAFQDKGDSEHAVASYRRAISLKPDYVEAHANLGIVLQAQGRLEEAASCYRRAIALKPDYVDAHNNLGMTLQEQGLLDEAITCFRHVLVLQPDFPEAHSNLLLCLNYLADLPISSYCDEARRYGRKAAGRVSEPFSRWRCPPKPERLCVGMVSGDFRNHSVGYFLENLLTNIDPDRIDLIAYPTNRLEDELTARLRSRFIAWKPLTGINDETAARLIHDDGVHVLIDLSGHTNHNRLPVFVWKPAPVQVSWLGYSASTGLAEMDYLLADPYVAPPCEDAHFTETIWRLPESYLCFSPPPGTLAVAPLPALNEGLVTFGCFNNPTKMNDSVVSLWAEVLHAVTGSRLYLKSKRFSDPAFCETTRQRFAIFDIAPERLILESFVKQREEHLAAYNRVDIALDPFPYNGTTTSVEGLWMGVPFITRRGDRFVSHVGESIAHNTGMTAWIANDHEDYVAKAASHASDLEALARLRSGLRQQVLASPVFNSQRFARNFEMALWGMWNRCGKA
jgi:protein O-GlcNAc transferase